MNVKVFELVIAAGDSLSGAVGLGNYSIVQIEPPTGAASFEALIEALLFHGSTDDATYNIHRTRAGVAESAVVAENNTYGSMWLEPAKFAGLTSIKVGTYKADLSTAVTQTAERTIRLVCAKVTG